MLLGLDHSGAALDIFFLAAAILAIYIGRIQDRRNRGKKD